MVQTSLQARLFSQEAGLRAQVKTPSGVLWLALVVCDPKGLLGQQWFCFALLCLCFLTGFTALSWGWWELSASYQDQTVEYISCSKSVWGSLFILTVWKALSWNRSVHCSQYVSLHNRWGASLWCKCSSWTSSWQLWSCTTTSNGLHTSLNWSWV